MLYFNTIYLMFAVLTNTVPNSAYKIDVSKEFPGQDVSDIDYKTFRIPLSVLKSTSQEARVIISKDPPKSLPETPVTIVVPIHVSTEDANEVSDYADDVGETDITPVSDETIAEDEITEPPPQEVVGQAIRFPCSCLNGQCGCCTGVFLERLKMKACGNITFVPEEFVFDVKFSMNNNTVMRRRVSASDPPPICFNPARAPFVEVCAELYNIHVKNRNAHACLDVNANIGSFPVYSTSFKCFSLGNSGIKTGMKPKPIKKPAGAPTATNLFGNGDSDDDSDDEGDDEDGFFGGGEGGGIFGGGEGGGIFGGGDDGGFEGPDFDGALEGVGGLIDA